MFLQWAQKLRRYYLLLIVASVVIFAVLQFTGLSVFSPPPCESAPEYREDVPADLRQTIDAFQEAGLLYCRDLREGLRTVAPTVYWGSDGLNSLIFFQAVEGENLSGVGVPAYTFGDGQDEFFPSRRGDWRHPGFTQRVEGRRVWRNQAESEDPAYYYRFDGAPGVGMATTFISVRGPAVVQEGLTDRSFLQDLERIINILRRQEQVRQAGRLITRDLTLLVDTSRWDEVVQREINPLLLDEEARMDYLALRDEVLPETILYQSAQSISGSTVWLAGLPEDANPAMVLVPRQGGPPIEPIEQSVWDSLGEGTPLVHFAFPKQPDGSVHEARYWEDAETRAEAEPDRTWPVAFPFLVDPAAEATVQAEEDGS